MKRLVLFICTILCANVLSAQTYDGAFYVEDLIYAYNNSNQTAVVYGYDYENPPTNAFIYESVIYQGVTYNVVGIEDFAFFHTYTENGWEYLDCSSLTSVTIPNSVISIGYGAFVYCSSLTSVTIPNSVTSIGGWAFRNCSSLTSVTIPNSVTSIGDGAFAYCNNLPSVTIPNSVTSIGGYAFRNCSSLTSIDIPNSVTSIGENAFYYCTSLESINLSDNIDSIGRNCFDSCINLTNVNIPTSLSVIDTSLFRYCTSLTSVTIPNSVTSIGLAAFRNCSSLTSVTIPNSVTSIGEGAFYYCTSLESINLSDNIDSIGRNCFDSCINLTNVNIPTSLSVIDTSLFRYCTSLTSVTIPENITDIKAWTFAGCSSLSSVICLAENAPSIDINVFSGTPNTKTLFVPCGSDYSSWQSATAWESVDCFDLNLGNSLTAFPLTFEIISEEERTMAVRDCDNSATVVVIPETVTYNGNTYNVTSIGGSAFYGCSSLTSVTIPNSVTTIERFAFYGCSSLTSVTIPNSITSIGEQAFRACSSLTTLNFNAKNCEITFIGSPCFSSSISTINIGDSVERIPAYFVSYCDNIVNIDIPNSVTSIGEQAFFRCYSLTSVSIPNSVTSIGESAFEYCSSLTSVTIPNSITSIQCGTFANCSSLTSITIPNSVTVIASPEEWRSGAFEGCSSLTSIDIPNSVTSIGESAFEGCSSLTSINIPNSVTSIGESAFEGCNSLTSVTFGESLAEIGERAFATSSFLQNITCLGTNPPILYNNSFPYPNIAIVTVPCGSLEAYSAPTSYWNTLFTDRISENGYNVEVSVNDETFGSVAVESDCSTATLTATANEGYVFLSWNDGNTDNPRTVALTSDTSFTAIFALIDESSLSEDAEFAELSVYPNPTRGKVSFNQAIEKIEVIDLSGKTVQTYENVNEINIEALPAGVYHLRMTIGDKTTTRKVIKE